MGKYTAPPSRLKASFPRVFPGACRRPAGEFFPVTHFSRTGKKPKPGKNSAQSGAALIAALGVLLFLSSAVFAGPVGPPTTLTPDELADGWISLFDGQTLFGWQKTSDANWNVEDGALTVSAGKEGFLMTGVEYGNYELHVEFRAPQTTNSGVFLHTPPKPTDPVKDCYELNIAPADNPFPTGSLVKRKKAVANQVALASLPPMIGSTDKPGKNGGAKAAVAPAIARESDGWHSFDVRMNNADVDVCLDRKRLYAYKDDTGLRRGHIGLQFREGPVAFRNIRLRPLGLKSMLNGKDLAGWNTDKAEAAKFELEPDAPGGRESFATGSAPSTTTRPVAKDSRPVSVLHATGGRGQLESNGQYGDFLLQLQCRVDADGINSGIFFRSIPHDFQNGYECQIQNSYKDNDPTKPADFGTGGIYRRAPARRLLSKDHEWFYLTLAATGPHIAAWVNGYQVTDWTDQRPPNDNPRKGLRTTPGTIILQAHDATTDVHFKNLRVAAFPKPKADE